MSKRIYISILLLTLVAIFLSPMMERIAKADSLPINLGDSGGDGGRLCIVYLNYGNDYQLAEIRVWSGSWIDALQTIYVNRYTGERVESSRCGGSGGDLSVFALDPDEYLTLVYGQYGDYVDSMTVVTNKQRLKTWGGDGGLADYFYGGPKGIKIVGFKSHAGQYVDAIGVFSGRVDNGIRTTNYFGPSEGTGGEKFSIEPPVNGNPRVKEVRVWSGAYIDAIEVIYHLEDEGFDLPGKRVGGYGGRLQVFKLATDEYITQIIGHRGVYVDSLAIVTNKGRSMQWGGDGGDVAYYYQAPPNGKIVGFRGRADGYVDAIGIVAQLD